MEERKTRDSRLSWINSTGILIPRSNGARAVNNVRTVSETQPIKHNSQLPNTEEQYFTFDKLTGMITGYDITGGSDVGIPAKIGGSAVKGISESAFESLSITSVSIPDSVDIIGDYAFASNDSLTTVVIGAGVKKIGKSAFEECAITSITIPDSVETISETAFSQNQLTCVTLGSGLTELDACAFSENLLEQIIVPANLEMIGAGAFSNNLLTSVMIESGVQAIGMCAFGMNQLAEIEIPNTVKMIGEGALLENVLTTITIGAGVTIGASLLTEDNNNFRTAYRSPTTGGAGTYTGTQSGSWARLTFR